MNIIVKEKETRCYKGDEPCFACPPKEVLALQLTLDEVSGHVATLSDGDLERTGFLCNDCIDIFKELDDYNVEIE